MNTNKLKLMDGLLVWGICFLIFGLIGDILSDFIGIWAFYLCQGLSIVPVAVVSARTGLSAGKLLAPGERKPKQVVGATLIWVGCLLLAIPLFLISHLLTPVLAKTGLHIYNYTNSTLSVVGLVILAGVAESILMDGFLYTRVKGFSKLKPWLPALILGALGGLYHPDLYILLPMAIMAVGFYYVRKKVGGIVLPMLLRMFTILIALAYMQVSDADDSLMGVAMGAGQVIGFALIFAGAALVSLVCGARVLGDFKDRTPIEKGAVLGLALLLIATGCGVASI